MFDFLIRRFVVNAAQRAIDRLEPKLSVHVPRDLPLDSISHVKKMSVTASCINALEPDLQKISDEELRAKTTDLKARYQKEVQPVMSQWQDAENRYRQAASGEERETIGSEITRAKDELKKARRAALDKILPEAFAVVREAGRRVIGLRHYDIQLIGGMILHQGKITEMATGEGKTLVSTLPAYLNALTGEGVHIVTVNDYLARRDREWMGPIYEFLGLSVGVILHDMNHRQRQEAYRCDITYGTNNEFGFDYLRDNMVSFKGEMVQRGHHYAVVDEVDSILIDEARTPLIISGPAEESTDKYYRANDIVRKLTGRRITEQEQIDAKHRNEDISAGYDYVADEKARAISLSEPGEEKAAKMFGVENLHDMDTIEYRHHILQALKAKEFFRIDVDYVVRDGQVIIVDEFTGRLMPGRRWSDGLHQAVEAKEGIKIERENQTLATITFQNYFRMYEKLAGMTGTAYTEANEFKQIYELDCVVLPTNRVLKRINYTDAIYKSAREKFGAVVEEIIDCHKRGQPVLVGTISIEKSEYLSAMLKQRGVPHQVLNAKYHELEAQIVAQAGRFKGVTIATNMAGRGTDIVLGGNAEFLARNLAFQKIQGEDEEALRQKEELTKKFLLEFREKTKQEHDQVVDIGGLHVLGTERHESRRIDNQLRGRSGRQGDPGSSKFFVSLEDDLMRLFASDRIMGIMEKLGMEEGQVIEHPWVSRAIEVAQKRVENHNFEIRKQLLEFDNVMNKQREAIYGLRRSILESENVKDRILEAIEDVSYSLVDEFVSAGKSAEITETGEEGGWDLDGLQVYLKAKFNFDILPERDRVKEMTPEDVRTFIHAGLMNVYEQKEKEITADHLRYLERMVLLNTIDVKWKDHLHAMDQLKEGVGLRSYGQRDPIIEYKREGFGMFRMMFASINREVAEILFKIQPAPDVKERRIRGVFSSLPQQMIHNEFTSLGPSAAAPAGPPPLAGQAAPTSSAPSSAAAVPPTGEAPKAKPIQRTDDKVGRNDPCPCGSGKKYKKCCGK